MKTKYAHGDQNQLYTFFDQWTGSTNYLNTVPAQEKLNMVYDDDKTTVISGFLGTASATSIDEVIAGMSEISSFDYANIVIDAGYGTEIMNLPWGLHTDTMWLAEHHLYGSSRLGVQRYDDTAFRNTYDINVAVTPKTGLNTAMPWYSFDYGDISAGSQKAPFVAIDNSSWKTSRKIGMKQYELTDHLGNVLATVLDRKTGKYINEGDTLYSYYHADLASVQDYYPFGMLMPGRFKFADTDTTTYRFGQNGIQKVNEIAGGGNHYTALFGEYDSRINYRWNLDPKPVSGISPYAMFRGNPILYSDVLLDTTYRFKKDGSYLGRADLDQAGRIGSYGSMKTIGEGKNKREIWDGQYFNFADATNDPKAIEGGVINKLIFVSDEEIKGLLTEQGAFNYDDKNNPFSFYNNSIGGQNFDYSYSVIPDKYGEQGASKYPLNTPSSVLFLPDGDNTAHNHMNFGNYLWGASGYTLGFSIPTLQIITLRNWIHLMIKIQLKKAHFTLNNLNIDRF